MPDRQSLGSGDFQDAFALVADMTRHFAEALDLESTLERALGSIAAHVGSEAGSLWLLDDAGEELTCVACVGPNPITGLRLPVSEGIIGRSVRENECQRVLDVARDPNFSQKMDRESGFVTRSLLCAPMSFSERVLGAIELINKRGDDARFVESDAHLLQTLASSAALAIANARLSDAQREHERMRRELELAAEIQRSLLPEPRPAPFPVHGVNAPARTVSGDFFDILPLDAPRIGFCLGDVSGKGMNAAILMAKTASLWRCLTRDAASPGEGVARLNQEICETVTRGMFVTLVAGVLDPGDGSVRLANAGHEPPLLHRAGGAFESLPAEAPPLGIVPDAVFPEQQLRLDGGALYVCTDGLTEAKRPDGTEFGRNGVCAAVERFVGKPLAERIDAIAAEAAGLDLRDDLTLLGVSDEARR